MSVTEDNIKAAVFLADAWGPALSHSFRMGEECGFRKGRIVGRAENDSVWQQIIGVYGEMMKHPTRVAIEAAQAEPIVRCARPYCNGQCSACIRCDALDRVGGDFAGGRVASW